LIPRPRTVVVLAADAEGLTSGGLASGFAEAVDQVAGEAAQVVGGVADRVVGTNTLQAVQVEPEAPATLPKSLTEV
jgi:hypothetical protein